MENGLIRNLKFLLDCVLELVYCGDEKCILCKKDLYKDKIICETCENNIKICKDSFNIKIHNTDCRCYSSAYYSGAMMELILKLKYKSSFKAGEVIAGYMKNTVYSNKINFDIITYVPMTKKSRKRRGYNQSEYLARILGKYLHKPVISCLNKIKDTKDQIGLDKEERWNNIQGSFKIFDKESIKNGNILIVDDVLTTGATAFCCCSELLRGGAKKINILTGAKSKV
ncbi:ComF family protein [Clostridium sp. WILCCON 0269]|uniref:ComF family protein n=1 Tax=Candidatus Clostridium eludens TaxID=3381663 RepID=A0ABW8SNG2_9CLOT